MVEIAEKASMIAQIRAQSRRDKLLILSFAILIGYLISILIIILPGIPTYYQRVTEEAVPTISMGSEQLVSNALIARRASDRGLSLDQYATYTVLRSLAKLLIFGGAALLILWRAGGNWFAWYTVFVLLLYPMGGTLNEIIQVSESMQASLVVSAYYNLASFLIPLFLLYLYLFPNGHAVPRWTRWPMGAVIAWNFLVQATNFLLSFGISDWLLPIWQNGYFVIILVGFPLILISQVLRYRDHSTPVERQQTKWFVGSLALLAILSVSQTVLTGSLDNEINWAGDLIEILDLLIPISLVISILRFRLWDIDVIIRKTLVYGALTATLAVVFFGGVAVLQQVFGRISGTEDSPVVIVTSTLLIAALFTPLRRRIQDFIDRRFYRRKYDAEQALAEFAEAARNETNLDALGSKLVAVVQETMQPESLAIWLNTKTNPAKAIPKEDRN